MTTYDPTNNKYVADGDEIICRKSRPTAEDVRESSSRNSNSISSECVSRTKSNHLKDTFSDTSLDIDVHPSKSGTPSIWILYF
jgi:hypothetical protein